MRTAGTRRPQIRLGLALGGVLLFSAIAVGRTAQQDEARSETFAAVPDDVLAGVGQTVVWTGEELFSHGGAVPGYFEHRGFPHLNTALLVDPLTGRGRRLADPPVDRALVPGKGILSGDGQSVILAGNECREVEREPEGCPPGTFRVLQLDLRSEAWTPIEIPAEVRGGTDTAQTVLGATGDLLVFKLGTVDDLDYWSHDLTDGSWLRLPKPPGRVDAECMTGNKLVVASASFASGDEILSDDPIELDGSAVYGEGDGHVDPRVAVLDVNSSLDWVTSSTAEDFRPEFVEDRVELACTADTAAVHTSGRQMQLHALAEGRLGEPWRAVPDPDDHVFGQVLADDGVFVLLSTNSINTTDPVPGFPARSYSLTTGRWTSQPHLPPASPALTMAGNEIVGFTNGFDHGSELVTGRLRGGT